MHPKIQTNGNMFTKPIKFLTRFPPYIHVPSGSYIFLRKAFAAVQNFTSEKVIGV